MMRYKHLIMSAAAMALTACSQASENADTPPPSLRSDASAAAETAAQPNFLVIVADDLGWSDMGAFGGEIDTPNLDKLATDGLMLTNFYVGGTCSPTRSMLMSGVDHHLAGLGTMGEHMSQNQVGQPGYETYLNDKVITIADRLKAGGYNTYMAGKWHLGMTEELSPAARGFDKSYVLLNGGASHFDQTGLHAMADPAPYREDGVSVDLPSDFKYSTDFYTKTMMEYIEGDRAEGAPFFAYLAYTAPHWPLHAMPEDIEKYKGRYDAGWHALREERLARVKSMGLAPANAQPAKIFTDWPAWDSLEPDVRAYEAKKMEVFAAMVDRVDQQIGVLIDYLKETGQYENTVILFMSDNGSEGAALQDIEPFLSWIPQFDGSFDALGTNDSYQFLEDRWAQVSSTPYRLFKGMASDGGSHVPAFITKAGANHQGGRYDGLLSVLDVAPTLLDLAGLPNETPEGIYPLQGKTIAPILQDANAEIRSPLEGIGYELFTKRYYRQGKWKVINEHPPWGPDGWQLFDMEADPGETKNLAAEYPEMFAQLVAKWEDYADINGVVLGDEPPER